MAFKCRFDVILHLFPLTTLPCGHAKHPIFNTQINFIFHPPTSMAKTDSLESEISSVQHQQGSHIRQFLSKPLLILAAGRLFQILNYLFAL